MFFIKKHPFLCLFLILAVTFFTRNNFKSVQSIVPGVLSPPQQYRIDNAALIRFQKNGYAYEVTPLYEYEVSALIVSKMNYKAFSIEKFDKVFSHDLCLIWGSNVSSRTYRNKSLTFSQDCRWCFARWNGDVAFNWEEFSNSHLFINNAQVEKKVKSLLVGDQVKIKGQLVNVKAHFLSSPGMLDSSEYTWNSGVGKTGLGAGACKVIYVENVEILKKANVISRVLFQLSVYGLLLLTAWKLFYLFKIPGNSV